MDFVEYCRFLRESVDRFLLFFLEIIIIVIYTIFYFAQAIPASGVRRKISVLFKIYKEDLPMSNDATKQFRPLSELNLMDNFLFHAMLVQEDVGEEFCQRE